MSKSLGNVIDLDEVMARSGVRPVELRYYLAAPHYRSRIDYSEASLREAAVAYQRIEDFVTRAVERVGAVPPSATAGRVRGRDGRRPEHVTGARARARDGARRQRGAGRRRRRRRDGRARAICGRCSASSASIRSTRTGPAPVRSTTCGRPWTTLVALALEQRSAARARKDWAAADAVRDQLKARPASWSKTHRTVHAGPSEPGRAADAREFAATWPSDDAEEGRGRRLRAVRAATRSRVAGRTLPADERPWHKAYSGTEDVPQRTAWKQDKERRAAAAEGRAPKIGQPGTQGHHLGQGRQAASTAEVRGTSQPCRHRSPAVAARPAGRADAVRSAGRSRPQVGAPEGRTRAAGRPQPGGRGAARADPGHGALRRARHRHRRPVTEAVRTATDRGIALLEITPGRARPDDRWRAAPGHRAVGAAVRV